VPWSSEPVDYAVIALDPDARSVYVTWALWGESDTAAQRGELLVPTQEPVNASDLLQRAFSPGD
jgi:hypothetical protein